ncbi:MAG: glutamate 5-kinase [Zoogloeaceae bacterium]|jgi:glutamate 5-kinase|nr:glutamate 5-kinase [Zoogloeaceae bacterium]
MKALADNPLGSARRLIVKIGSALVAGGGQGVDVAAIQDWARQIARLQAKGRQVILVSSGAIACGMRQLALTRRPREMHELQACAAVGQMALARIYEAAFAEHGLRAAQVLLTEDDLADRERYLNARATLGALLAMNVVPVINENDTVATAEIKFGDNDTLGALVANAVEADALILLTDQPGLYTADPRKHPTATLVAVGQAGDPALEAMAGGAGTAIGTGGMLTKIRAAKRAARSGAATVIASGHEKDVLLRLMAGEALGTRLLAQTEPLAAKKQWLADQLKTAGELYVDAGAQQALEHGKSLLPVGVLSVIGDFSRGAAVSVIAPNGHEIARGLINYKSSEARQIVRHPSADIEKILGYVAEDEMVHRDNLVRLG